MGRAWLLVLTTVMVLTTALSLTSGCLANLDTVRIERTLTQNALVPAPTGPRATGHMAAKGRAALELGYTANPVRPSRRSHLDGERGDVVLKHMVRLGASVGLSDFLELGLHAEFGGASMATAVAADGRRDMIESVFGRGGPSLRLLAPVGKRAKLGALIELELASIPFVAEIYERAWLNKGKPTAAFQHPWRYGKPSAPVDLGDRLYFHEDSKLVPMVRTGVQLGVDLGPRALLLLGFLVQNIPTFDGAASETFVCLGLDPTAQACAAARPPNLPRMRYLLVGTLFAALSVRAGPIVLVGQIAAHPIATESIQKATPVSIDLTARYQF